MDVGTEDEPFVTEPIEEPFEVDKPDKAEPQPEPVKRPEPVRVPETVPDKVPA